MAEQIDGRTLRYQHRRSELLDAVGEYVLEHGIATMSLRRVAQQVGVSHATLQHHFGTKEELVDEIVEHLLNRTIAPTPVRPVLDADGRLRDLWASWTSPTGRRDIRLFLEIIGQSLFDEPGYAQTMKRSVQDRVGMLTRAVIAQGCPPHEAPGIATLLIAQLRGLMTDLLVTGDTQRIEAAVELMLENARRRVELWNSDDGAQVRALRAVPQARGA
jgi:AcrR family transcriptional regulator